MANKRKSDTKYIYISSYPCGVKEVRLNKIDAPRPSPSFSVLSSNLSSNVDYLYDAFYVYRAFLNLHDQKLPESTSRIHATDLDLKCL